MQPRHTDPVSIIPTLDTIPEFLNYGHNLMSRNDWVMRRDDIALDRVQVRMAYSTSSDAK
jgi:hypothetical protein